MLAPAKGIPVTYMRWRPFLEAVQERGDYPSVAEAERASRVVLALLGAHLVGEERNELAARLPETFALILLNPLQAAEPLSSERFVRAVSAWIEGATERTAAWDTGAVLSVVADASGEELLERLLLQLPRDTTSCSATPGADLSRGPRSVRACASSPPVPHGRTCWW